MKHMSEKIIINNNENCFVLECDANVFLNDKMLQISLRRLGYMIINNQISIQFDIEDNVKTLQSIESILKKFSIIYELSDSTANIVSNYKHEMEQFEIFSEKAKKIRNDEFKDNQDLVILFEGFQETLSKKLTNRKLYPLQLLSSFHMAFAQNSCNFSVP